MSNIIINMTPHEVCIGDRHIGSSPDGVIPRVIFNETKVESICDLPIVDTTVDGVIYLPKSKQGVYLIVSSIVAAAEPLRRDLLVPHDPIRNSSGQVISCTSLARRKNE